MLSYWSVMHEKLNQIQCRWWFCFSEPFNPWILKISNYFSLFVSRSFFCFCYVFLQIIIKSMFFFYFFQFDFYFWETSLFSMSLTVVDLVIIVHVQTWRLVSYDILFWTHLILADCFLLNDKKHIVKNTLTQNCLT